MRCCCCSCSVIPLLLARSGLGGVFFFHPGAKRRKKRTTGRQRGTTEGEGEGPRGGQGKCQTALSFGAQPCCPEGPSRSEAEWSHSPMGVEKRRAAKRNREVAFALQSQATGTEKKQAGQVRVLKLIGISTQWAHSACLKRVKHGIGDLPTVSRWFCPGHKYCRRIPHTVGTLFLFVNFFSRSPGNVLLYLLKVRFSLQGRCGVSSAAAA